MSHTPYKILLAHSFHITDGECDNLHKFGKFIQKRLDGTKYRAKIALLESLEQGKGKGTFDPKNFSTRLKVIIDSQKWESLNGVYCKYLVVFCGYDNFGSYKKSYKTLMSDEQIDECISKLITISTGKEPENTAETNHDHPHYIIRAPFFKDRETIGSRYRINSLTNSLYWAKNYIINYIDGVEQNENIYRYLLLSETTIDILSEFAPLIEHNTKLKGRFHFRGFWDSKFKNPFLINNIEFPLFNDLVFYEKYNEIIKDFEFECAIVGVIPIDGIPPDDNFSVAIPQQQGRAMYAWFKNAWRKLKDDIDIQKLIDE